MNYINKRLNLTAEPAKLNPENYCVNIDGELRLIHKSLIEGSSDWEKQPDWVITAFKYDDSDIIKVLGDDGLYHISVFTYTLDELQVSKAQIHSVRRSDGVEFKVGDKVKGAWEKPYTIVKFEIHENIMRVFGDDVDRAWENLDDIQPTPTVLFTTHDGVDYSADTTKEYFTVGNSFSVVSNKVWQFKNSPCKDCKRFSTKEAAEAYIAENKPLYSLADIRKAWNEFKVGGFDDFEELLKQVK